MEGYNARATSSRGDTLYLASSIVSLLRADDPAEVYGQMLKSLDPLSDDDYREAAIEAGLHPPPD